MEASFDAVDPRELAALKQAFGAVLSDEERRLIEDQPDPDSQPSARSFRATLQRWGCHFNADPNPEDVRREAGPSELIARFETSAIKKAQDFLRIFPRFLAVVTISLLLLGASVVYLLLGTLASPKAIGPMSLFLVAAIGVSLLLRHRAKRVLHTDNLIRLASSLEPATARRSTRSKILLLGIGVLYGLQVATIGWLKPTVSLGFLFSFIYVASLLAERSLKKQRMREDEEMWRWWYGDARTPGSRE
ncbi:MAG: hypothetical protein AAF628_07725 [Planctomycetota bacterium]